MANIPYSFYIATICETQDVTSVPRSVPSRLEDLLSKVVEAGAIKPTDTNDMLSQQAQNIFQCRKNVLLTMFE